MRPKILAKRTLLIIAFSGLTFSAAFFLYFNSIRGSSAFLIENAAALSNQEQANIGSPARLKIQDTNVDTAVEYANLASDETIELPARLKIPSINVDSAVAHVGLTSDGAMDAPKEPDEVTWFNLGPRPGEIGSAVIAGHYGWKNNIPAVFDNLHKLLKGDKISVEDEKGATITFVVRESRMYGKDEIVPDVFGSSDGKAHLNLITCAGVWNKAEQTRPKRLIVFTDKE